MKTSDKGVAFIAAHEGIVTKAYRDSVGVWTIGVGHTAAAGAPVPVRGMTISREEALQIFARDLGKFEVRVSRAFSSPGRAEGGAPRLLPDVPQHAYDAGASFDFNTGAINRASWVPAYLAGKLEDARVRMLSWNKPAVIRGRRKDEARLLIDGAYGALPDLKVAPPAGVSPAESSHPDDVETYQRQLTALGFYRGPVDGAKSQASYAAVIDYQRTHPDLVADGIVGPATRASLARDVAAKNAPIAAAGGTGAVIAAAGAATAATGHPWLWVAIGAGVLLFGLLGFLIVRERVSR